jgi:hypothetical protein
MRNFNPRIAACLIAFEALVTECEACKRLLRGAPIEASDRMLAQNYQVVAAFL